MYRTLVFFVAATVALPLAARAQQPLEGVTRSIDSFSDDTLWSTKYGRLDNPQGCGRLNLAITWHLRHGAAGSTEILAYQWVDASGPFHTPEYMGGVAVALNIDGEMIEGEMLPLSSRLTGDRSMKQEGAQFSLPAGTLRKVADARVAKLKIGGTRRTCDGIIEPNMKTRLSVLLAYLDKLRP